MYARPSAVLWLAALLFTPLAASGQVPGAPTVVSPANAAIVGSNRPDITWTGPSHDMYEVHIGSWNSPLAIDGWNSGQVVSSANTAYSGVLQTQKIYWVFVRLHNANGWGPWSALDHRIYTDGEFVNDPYFVAGPDGLQWPQSMAYNPNRNEFLVAYNDVKSGQRGRISWYRLDGNGVKIGSEVTITDDTNLDGTHEARVTYNSVNQEYLVVYSGWTTIGGLHDEVRGQRVNATTGAKINGSYLVFSSTHAVFELKSVYSSNGNAHLAAWHDGSGQAEIFAIRLAGATGAVTGSLINLTSAENRFSAVPIAAVNATAGEFAVLWQVSAEDVGQGWNYYGQRIRASDGALLGSVVQITNGAGWEFNGDLVYDSGQSKYLLIYEEGGAQIPIRGQFLTSTLGLSGGAFDVGTPSTPGGAPRVERHPSSGEFLVGWLSCCSNDDYARRISSAGVPIADAFRINGGVQTLGNWEPKPVANTTSGEYLIGWFNAYNDVWVRRYKTHAPFSYPTSFVSIDLGNANIQNGMTSPIGGDGDTIGTSIGGRECRRNMDPGFNDYYFYFTVSDSFIYQGNNPAVDVVVDYYDTGTGSLQLQYDATSSAYKVGPSITLTNTNTWKTFKYRVTDAYFGNRQNNASDFRIYGGNVFFYIDAVKVTDASPVTTLNAAPSTGQPPLSVSFTAGATDADSGANIAYEWDFGDGAMQWGGTTANHSYTNIGTFNASFSAIDNSGLRDTKTIPIVVEVLTASCDMGSTNVDNYLNEAPGGDGDTSADTIGGRNCRRNMDPGYNDAYFYFNVGASYAYQGNSPQQWITIQYYDNSYMGSLALNYDGSGGAYTNGGSVGLTGTNTWKQYTFHVTDAYFGNRQNNGADFRIGTGGGVTRYLDVVSVSKTAPSVAPGQAGSPSPADGATGVSLSAQLTWSAGETATSHDVYFGTNFPPAFKQNQTAASYNPGSLAPLTTYYWRIDEKNGNGTTTGVTWSFTTSAGSLVTFSTSSFATSADGWSIVTWKAGPYSDGTMAFDNSAGNLAGSMRSTGSGGSNNTDSCTREGGELNKVISTAGHTSLRINYDLAFITNQTGTTTTGSCTANLVGGDAADKLGVYYSTTGGGGPWTLAEQVYASNVAQGIFMTRSLDLSSVTAASNNPNFALRLRFQFNTDTDAGWLDNVKVSGNPNPPPGPATNPNPANGATSVSRNADLTWTAGSGATSHDVYFGTSNPPGFIQNQTSTSFDPGTMAAGTLYYWRIDEKNTAGTTTGTVWSFTTLPLPGLASGPSPSNGASGVSINADLAWTTGSNADSHDVRFGTSSPPPFIQNQAGTTFDPGTLTAGLTYYWRIDELNPSGTTTGTVWSFTTLPLPGLASNPAPASGATGVAVSGTTLGWTAGSNASSHDVRFGTSNPPAFVQNQAGTAFNPGTLAPSTVYYWRIDEVNASGTTTGSVWSFTTATPPGAPAVTAPANGGTVTSLTPTITWSGAAHDGYQVRVTQQNDANTSTNGWDSGDVTSTGNSAVSGTLRDFSYYFVFVRLRNAGGWGAWSSSSAFVVNTNAANGTLYLGDVLPTSAGWAVYDNGSFENGGGITSSIVDDGGTWVWQLLDNSATNRCKERYLPSDVSFNTGASVAARMRAWSVAGTPTYNLGISNGNVGGMFLRLYTNEVRLVDINGTNRGSYALDATVHHKYQLTVKNATQGNNATAAWRVYVDGTQRITWTGAGVDNGFDGFFAGQAGTAATGYWLFDWVAGRADGEFAPSQWDPVY